jgi:hypothetical protein
MIVSYHMLQIENMLLNAIKMLQKISALFPKCTHTPFYTIAVFLFEYSFDNSRTYCSPSCNIMLEEYL